MKACRQQSHAILGVKIQFCGFKNDTLHFYGGQAISVESYGLSNSSLFPSAQSALSLLVREKHRNECDVRWAEAQTLRSQETVCVCGISREGFFTVLNPKSALQPAATSIHMKIQKQHLVLHTSFTNASMASSCKLHCRSEKTQSTQTSCAKSE